MIFSGGAKLTVTFKGTRTKSLSIFKAVNYKHLLKGDMLLILWIFTSATLFWGRLHEKGRSGTGLCIKVRKSVTLILIQPDKAAAAILWGGGGRGISFCEERAHTAPHCAENVQIQRAQCPPPPSPAETTGKAYKVLSEKNRTE
jgi:hypothetical protein